MAIETISIEDSGGVARDVLADLIAGVGYGQVLKLAFGVDGSITLVSSAAPLPVTLDAATVAALEPFNTVELGATTLAALESITVVDGGGSLTVDGTVTVQDGGGSLTVDGTVELGATSLAALETIELGATTLAALETINAVSSGVAAAGAALSGNPVLAGFSDGTNVTVPRTDSIGRIVPSGAAAHDAAAAGNPHLMGGYASAAAPSDVSTDGDAVRLWALKNGSLVINLAAAGALIAGDATNGLDVDVTRLPTISLGASANNIGDVDVLTLPALPAGTNAIGKLVANAGVTIGAVEIAASQTLATVTTVTTVSTLTGGPTAHDGAATGNPHLMAGYASAAAPTNVSADGDVTRMWVLRNGAQAVNVTAAGALIGGDATNGLDVDVTRLSSLVAGTAMIGHVGGTEYETVAASQTDQILGATGAAGDYLAGVLIVPGTTSPGAVSIKDANGSAFTIFAGGASSVSNLVPFFVPIGAKCTGATTPGWKVTTGANVTAMGVGDFT